MPSFILFSWKIMEEHKDDEFKTNGEYLAFVEICLDKYVQNCDLTTFARKTMEHMDEFMIYFEFFFRSFITFCVYKCVMVMKSAEFENWEKENNNKYHVWNKIQGILG